MKDNRNKTSQGYDLYNLVFCCQTRPRIKLNKFFIGKSDNLRKNMRGIFSSASLGCDNSIPGRKFAETADYLQNVQSTAASVSRRQLGHMSWPYIKPETYIALALYPQPGKSKQIAQFSFALSSRPKGQIEERGRTRGSNHPRPNTFRLLIITLQLFEMDCRWVRGCGNRAGGWCGWAEASLFLRFHPADSSPHCSYRLITFLFAFGG